jgi:hypothetical protein
MASKTRELGVASDYRPDWGLRLDEFVPELRGTQGIRKLREMAENDPIVSAILTSMDLMIRSVHWRFTGGSEMGRQVIEEILHDMDDKTFPEFISDVLSFLPYGFSIFEIVAKRKQDGVIGLKKLAPRAQWTIDRFESNDVGDILGVHQQAVMKGVFIPYDKLLHFRTRSVNNQPAGVSVLRGAYTSWYYSNMIKQIEATSIERELNGLPVWSLPGEWFSPDAEPWQKQFVLKAEQIGRDVKRNEQGFIIKPSNLWEQEDGRITDNPMVKFDLIASQGSRDIDTGKTILRYQQDMARSAMADFVMLGANDRGSFALSQSKSDLFLKALEGYLDTIAAVINRRLIPKLGAWNGMAPADLPTISHGRVAPVNLIELGQFIQRLSQSKFNLFEDTELEDHLRDVAGLPERPVTQTIGDPPPTNPGNPE